MTPEWISNMIAYITIFIFWIFAGFMLTPFWLFISIFGALIGTYEWREVPKIFWWLFTVRFVIEG